MGLKKGKNRIIVSLIPYLTATKVIPPKFQIRPQIQKKCTIRKNLQTKYLKMSFQMIHLRGRKQKGKFQSLTQRVIKVLMTICYHMFLSL